MNRHRTIATQLVIIFHFYGIFLLRGLNCEKSLFFHHIFTVHLSCLELTYYPHRIRDKQFIRIWLQFFFALKTTKNQVEYHRDGHVFQGYRFKTGIYDSRKLREIVISFLKVSSSLPFLRYAYPFELDPVILI